MVDILCVLFVMFMVFAIVLWYFMQDYSEWRKYSKGKPYWEKDFYNDLASYAYRVPYTKEEENGTLLYVEQIKPSLYNSANRVLLLMDAFWAEKVSAESLW